jgi:hypothetical protein
MTMANGSVDAGWVSRKLILGVLFGLLMIVAASVMAVWSGHYTAGTAAGWFTDEYWLYGCIAGLVMVGGALGLISVDKVLDLVREALPLIKARFGAPPKAGS